MRVSDEKRATDISKTIGEPTNKNPNDEVHRVVAERGVLRRDEDAMRLEVASYISEMSGELAAMAQGRKLETIIYFLEMARLESSSIAQKAERRGMTTPTGPVTPSGYEKA